MVVNSKEEIIRKHLDERPNRYNIAALITIVGLLLIFIVFNLLGLVEVNHIFICVSAIASIVCYLIIYLIGKKKLIDNPKTKYIIMGICLLMIFIIYVLLNIYATLGLLVPIIISTQYSSKRITIVTIILSMLIALIGPIFSYYLGSFSYKFQLGFIQSVFGLDVVKVAPATLTELGKLTRIIQYLSIPSAIIVGGIGILTIALTKNNRDSLDSQIEAAELSSRINEQLDRETKMKERMLSSLSDIIESRDATTGSHVRRTVDILEIILNRMVEDENSPIDEKYAEMILKVAPTHDLGKIAISDDILNKPGPLTKEEYDIIKTHPLKSADIIRTVFSDIMPNDLYQIALNIALYHHEKFDGSGYPFGLKGEDIPLEARIVAMADVYDALVSKRPYKNPYSFKEAADYMDSVSNSHFDQRLYPYFKKSLSEIEKNYQNN